MAGLVFSWAEDANGRMVHVDNVHRGLKCACSCPYCHEPLLARHGDINEHGFAHHSETRKANLEICYMVTMYKLAEQIIQERKLIHVPSYYGIFKEKDICFANVKIDSSFEREDKQPDVVATTENGEKYLIEFTFDYKVQHKQPIDYKNMNCLEINLRGQTLETLEDFLLTSVDDREWINNETYFNRITEIYAKNGKTIKVVPETECGRCELRYDCCAVKEKSGNALLVIENSGQTYKLCKTELYNEKIEEREQRRLQQVQSQDSFQNTEEISCFNCKSNLSWANKKGLAYCGRTISLNLPNSMVNPDYAKKCEGFKRKKEP